MVNNQKLDVRQKDIQDFITYCTELEVIKSNNSNRKKYYACEHNILIDDLSMNINQWREKKGIGILHKNAQETIQQLNAIKQQIGCC